MAQGPWAAICLVSLAWSSPAHCGEALPREGVVEFRLTLDERRVPQQFRLPRHTFAYRQTPLETASKAIEISEVTFPSPVTTEHPANNTVHCEFFRPAADGQYPAVVALHILGGDFELARVFARTLAHNGVCALFLKMPYYGPRRNPGSRERMVTHDPRQSAQGMTQAILDIRRAAAWLDAQETVDGRRLGVFGISLGGITGALALAAEPRFSSGCLLLAGADVGTVGWTAKELKPVRERWLAQGGTREEFVDTLARVDPARYAHLARDRRILMINANHDEVVPRASTVALWESLAKPEIVWLDCGHYSAARFIFESLARATRFFQGRTGLTDGPTGGDMPASDSEVEVGR